MAPKQLSFICLMIPFLFLLAAVPPAYAQHRGFRATMMRRETTINFTRAAQLSHERQSTLAARLAAAAGGASAQTPLQRDRSGGGYDMEISIGTPPLELSAVADTGSDLIWAKCGTCALCSPRGSPSYFPDRSSTFSTLPCADRRCVNLQSQSFAQCAGGGARCVYRYLYGDSGDSSYAQGYLGTETFTLGGDAAPGIGFGCTTSSEGAFGTGSGLVGLGRGPLSLVSQLNVGAFSYCLNPDPSKASPLLFGSQATLTGTGVQSTPLLQGDDATYYAVNMRGISIGATTASAGNGGVVIFDSGTTLTLLADPAYTAAKEAVLSQTALPQTADRSGFEACFQLPTESSTADPFPAIVLHFDGADMELQTSNSFVQVERGVACWVVQRTSGVAIIGNIMQANFHVRYGVDESLLSFQQVDCDGL